LLLLAPLLAPALAPASAPVPPQEPTETQPTETLPAEEPAAELAQEDAEPGSSPSDWRIGSGPWDDDLALLRSPEGSSWERVGVLVEDASLPSACRLPGGDLLVAFQWFPFDRPDAFQRIAVIRSDDDGETWSEPRTVAFEGLPDQLGRPSGPCVVALPDGRLRMYFTAREGRSDSEDGAVRGGWQATWSAVSDDGLAWTFEPGQRFGIEGLDVSDPTVVRFRDEWHYLAPIADRVGAALHAVSTDGRTFARWPEVEVRSVGPWQGSAVAEAEHGEPDAYLRFYGTGRVGWSAISRDTKDWRLDGRVAWSQGDRPAVVVLQDGSRLMVATVPGAVRRDADRALLDALTGGPTVAMTANDRFLYVLRGETIYMYDASTLRFLRLKRLPPLKADEEADAPADRPSEEAPVEGGDGER
jgi:hypothetical protein